MTPRPGVWNDLSDVPGVAVGQAETTLDGRATGVTVVRCARLTTAAIDQRGGGPATRETDLLKPDASVAAAHAIVLSGGSVFGLAAAEAVVEALSAEGVGLRVAAAAPPIPIVPAAAIFDLGRGPAWAQGDPPPYRALGRTALAAAVPGAPIGLGAVGAGAGARAGLRPGGVGSASLDLGGGLVVAALVVANPVGAARMPDGSAFWAWPFEIDAEAGGARPAADAPPAIDPTPPDGKLAAGAPRLATVIGVVAASADLDAAEATRFAIMAQAGVARAVRPAHTPYDGDTLFALATGAARLEGDRDARRLVLARLGSAAADCVARAIARGCHAAGG